jgi:hypothetical protein
MDMIKRVYKLLDVLYFELPTDTPEISFWLEESQESGNPFGVDAFDRISIGYSKKIGASDIRYLDFNIDKDGIDSIKVMETTSPKPTSYSYEGSFDNISNNPIIKEFIKKYDEFYKEI